MAPPRSASASAPSAAARPPDRPPLRRCRSLARRVGAPHWRNAASDATTSARRHYRRGGGGEGGQEGETQRRSAPLPSPPRARTDGSGEAGPRGGGRHWPTCPGGAAAHWRAHQGSRARRRFRGGPSGGRIGPAAAAPCSPPPPPPSARPPGPAPLGPRMYARGALRCCSAAGSGTELRAVVPPAPGLGLPWACRAAAGSGRGA